MSTLNICFHGEIRKLLVFFGWKMCLIWRFNCWMLMGIVSHVFRIIVIWISQIALLQLVLNVHLAWGCQPFVGWEAVKRNMLFLKYSEKLQLMLSDLTFHTLKLKHSLAHWVQTFTHLDIYPPDSETSRWQRFFLFFLENMAIDFLWKSCFISGKRMCTSTG